METAEAALRPMDWDEWVGQEQIKNTLTVRMDAALAKDRMLPHVLLAAPPGYGKTSLAGIIVSYMSEPCRELVMPIKGRALVGLLLSWRAGGVLFLDEIHRAKASQQEDLLSLLSDGFITTPEGRRIEHQMLTVIGATTEPEKLIAPLRDRFPIKPHYVPYTEAEMRQIVIGMGEKVNIEFSETTADVLGRAAGTTPRYAQAIVLAARDLADSDLPVNVPDILALAGVDEDGLSHEHTAYLNALHRLGGQAGEGKLRNFLRMHPSLLNDIERLLVERDMICFTGAGRELLPAGYSKIKGNDPARRRNTPERTKVVI